MLVECRDIDNSGYGLSVWNDYVLVTPNLIPGEQAIVQIKHRSGSRWYSSIVTIIGQSDNREIPQCKVFNECGGCSLQHISNEEQWFLKTKHIKDAFERIGGIGVELNNIFNQNYIKYAYRNKAIIPIKTDPTGKLVFGYYKRHSHNIIDLYECPVLDPRINKFIPILKNELQTLNL